ncbi:hypothetical protein IQ268_27495, partial [Oculatella sp. LEGE 06141]|uniref:hypothetical protein n=1 Tax=Oculatella sp. LEGE 06141 TaxID=1828648 RepID=UPI0018813110
MSEPPVHRSDDMRSLSLSPLLLGLLSVISFVPITDSLLCVPIAQASEVRTFGQPGRQGRDGRQ